jgi:DNA-binding IclR family transcriptional regulator
MRRPPACSGTSIHWDCNGISDDLMHNLAKFMQLLRLFDLERNIWTAPALAQELRLPVSTVYRWIRELLDAGLLEAAPDAHYRLGPAFVEFDRRMRLTDPLLRLGSDVAKGLVESSGIPCIGLIARLYDATVMCVVCHASADIDFESRYERGRPMPLVRGAASKAILAQLPARRLDQLLHHPQSNSEAVDEVALRRELTEIRLRGIANSRGEVDHGLMGIAAPVIVPSSGIVASLTLGIRIDSVDLVQERRYVAAVTVAAHLLSDKREPNPSCA